MEYTKIFFVRHGQSDGNLLRKFYGQYPGMLTELGHRQANAVADYLKNKKLDCIYSSDLKRAYETAMPTALSHRTKPIADSGLREIYAGKWECISWNDIEKNYPRELEVWKKHFSQAGCPQGESIKELYNRISAHVRALARAHIGQTIAVFSHAAALRVLGCDWSGHGIEYADTECWFANASISEIKYFKDGTVEPILVGFDGHLKGISFLGEA